MIFKRFLTNMQKKNSFRFFENRWSNPIDDRTSTNLLHNFVKKTRPGDLVGAGPNWVTFWSKFGLF